MLSVCLSVVDDNATWTKLLTWTRHHPPREGWITERPTTSSQHCTPTTFAVRPLKILRLIALLRLLQLHSHYNLNDVVRAPRMNVYAKGNLILAGNPWLQCDACDPTTSLRVISVYNGGKLIIYFRTSKDHNRHYRYPCLVWLSMLRYDGGDDWWPATTPYMHSPREEEHVHYSSPIAFCDFLSQSQHHNVQQGIVFQNCMSDPFMTLRHPSTYASNSK